MTLSTETDLIKSKLASMRTSQLLPPPEKDIFLEKIKHIDHSKNDLVAPNYYSNCDQKLCCLFGFLDLQ